MKDRRIVSLYEFVANRLALASITAMIFASAPIAVSKWLDLAATPTALLSGAGLLAICGVMLVMTRSISKLLTTPLQQLESSLSGVEHGAPAPLKPPARAPRELHTLNLEFAQMANRLQRSSEEVRDALAHSNRLRQEIDNLVTNRARVEEQSRELQERTESLEALNKTLKRLSSEDALTGLDNRRALDEYLDSVWRHAERHERTLSLLMLDIDYFKLYNDTLGHQAGDACLVRVAEVLKQHVRRAMERAARYGGEEFCVVLPDTSGADAMQVALDILGSLRAAQMPHPRGINGIVTASIGVASAIPGVDDLKHPASLVQLADELLYEAKRGGRDRAVSEQTAERSKVRVA